MSSGEGAPPVFDGEHFPYWKIHMEFYLEAIDISLHTAAIIGFPTIVDKNKPTLEELSLSKDVFNHVRNIKDTQKLCKKICALHEGTLSEKEQHHSLLSKKINAFNMLPHENANKMYSRFNILVEEYNGLGLTQIAEANVARGILDFLSATPFGMLGKINAHEMYMNITPDEKDEEEDSDEEMALLVRKVTSALSCLDKKKFFPSKKKLEEMDKKKKEKKHCKHDSSDESSEDEKKSKKKDKKQLKKKLFKKKGNAYIGEWMTDNDTISNSSFDSSDDEDELVARLAIATTSTPPPASSTSSSTPHLCLMVKSSKVKTLDDSSDDDFPSYDELASLVQEQNHAISKLGKFEKMQKKVESLEERNKKLFDSNEMLSSSNKQLTMEHDALDEGYNMIKKFHIEQTQEIKELNETIEEVNKYYKELTMTHEELSTRHQLLQLHCVEIDEARKELELNLQAIN
ncbi:hypothetical protein BS78_K040700 [Paspalum vaginatum]|uniref:DUF4219 domain-containing protein n=1 Tax=Paspalum vaginatum TaxID=158149 RepID=A0A9W7XCA5_9POAL|nr:hypothetical protein BS78_K040700 [Paspalum vaginatum]